MIWEIGIVIALFFYYEKKHIVQERYFIHSFILQRWHFIMIMLMLGNIEILSIRIYSFSLQNEDSSEFRHFPLTNLNFIQLLVCVEQQNQYNKQQGTSYSIIKQIY